MIYWYMQLHFKNQSYGLEVSRILTDITDVNALRTLENFMDDVSVIVVKLSTTNSNNNE